MVGEGTDHGGPPIRWSGPSAPNRRGRPESRSGPGRVRSGQHSDRRGRGQRSDRTAAGRHLGGAVAGNVSERESRQVAEEAREREWRLPSFGKELFLGNFRLDLIHPQPRLDPDAVERGERFLAELRGFLEREVDPLQIEREAKIPESVIEG